MLIAHNQLEDFVRRILLAAGSSEQEAGIVAGHLVRANLTGHDSHGVGMVPTYMKNLANETLRPNAVLEKILDRGAILQFDAHRGYGQRLAKEAMAQAIERCRESGLVMLTVRNAHHIGRVGAYAEQALQAGLVSLMFVNVTDHRPLVAPQRGSDARFATNPVCIGFPAAENQREVLLDMATSKVALGKVRVAMNKNERMAQGTLFDGQGQATTDPTVMFEEPFGAITPLGEHKGYGLALLCELLAGGLSGGGTIQPDTPRRGGIVNNLMAILIDPQALVDLSWLRQEAEKLIAYVKESPAANPAEPVLIPGDPERLSERERREGGVPIDPTTWGQLTEIAHSLKVEVPG